MGGVVGDEEQSRVAGRDGGVQELSYAVVLSIYFAVYRFGGPENPCITGRQGAPARLVEAWCPVPAEADDAQGPGGRDARP